MIEQLFNPITLTIYVAGICIALLLGMRLAKDPSFGVALIAFFLPFERIPSLDLGGFTFKVNHFIAGLTFIFWLLAVAFNRRKIAPNPLTIPLLLLFFTFLLSGLGAGDSYRQLTVYVSMLIMFFIYLTVINTLTDKTILQTMVGFLLLSAALMGLISLYQFFGDLAGLPATLTGLDPGYTKVVFGFPRVHAFSKEPLYYANYLFIPLGVSLALFFSKPAKDSLPSQSIATKFQGPWLLPLIVLLLVSFVLTLSRGAFIALVPFTLIFALFYQKQVLSGKNITLAILILIISLTSVYKILDSVSYDALDRFLSHAGLSDVLVTKSGESGFGRLNAFNQAIQAFETSPLLGIGLGNFGPHIANYPLGKPPTGWEIVNNEYLELLAETGILGISAFLLILAVLFTRSVIAYRKTEDEYLKAVLVGLTAATVAILTQYNFFSTLYIIHIWVVIGMVIAIQNIILRPKQLPVVIV